MATPAANWDSEEWEVVNDTGFVYKRKKRHTGPVSFPRADPELNPILQYKRKLKRKRTALLQVKDKYQREIALWDNLANAFKAMEDRVKSKLQLNDSGERDRVELHGPFDKGSKTVVSVEKNKESLVHELLLRVEAQEAIIHNFQQLCDVVDSFCDAQEEKTKQEFFDLPIWKSLHELKAFIED